MLRHQGLHTVLSSLAPGERTASRWATGAEKTACFAPKAPSVIRAARNLRPAHREHRWPVKYQHRLQEDAKAALL